LALVVGLSYNIDAVYEKFSWFERPAACVGQTDRRTPDHRIHRANLALCIWKWRD